MPITPLHFGVLAPVNHVFPGKVSNVSFVLVTLWIDADSIAYAAFGLGHYDRGALLTLDGALITATLVALFGIRSRRWLLGAYLAGVTHVLLDALVHPKIQILPPWVENPLYVEHVGVGVAGAVGADRLVDRTETVSRPWLDSKKMAGATCEEVAAKHLSALARSSVSAASAQILKGGLLPADHRHQVTQACRARSPRQKFAGL